MEDVTNDNPDIKTDNNNEVHTTGIFIIYHYYHYISCYTNNY